MSYSLQIQYPNRHSSFRKRTGTPVRFHSTTNHEQKPSMVPQVQPGPDLNSQLAERISELQTVLAFTIAPILAGKQSAG